MKKKILCGIISILLIFTVAGCMGRGSSTSQKPGSTQDSIDQPQEQEPVDTPISTLSSLFREYISAWEKSDFKSMYSALGKRARTHISEDNFVQRYSNIYKGIEVASLIVKADFPTSIELDDFERAGINYRVSMETAAGPLEFSNTAMFREEETDGQKQWRLLWDDSMIFPDMEEGDVVRITRHTAVRGEIRDRNGKPLAANGTIAEIGLVPQDLGENADASKNRVSEILGMTIEAIDKKLTASYVKPYMFISLKTMSNDEKEVLGKLREIPGVMIRDKAVRVYPLAEKAAHLTGYIQQLNADELKKLSAEGYTADDFVGKVGLEKIYEDKFKSEGGIEIYIEDKFGTKKKTIINKQAKPGIELILSIDSDLQNAIFDELKDESGAGIAVNPRTGEVLALVSTPAYNPNSFVLGMSSSEWNSLVNSPKKPLFNRFQATFSPGSAFKPITAAIALDTNVVTPEQAFDISGLRWQKDSTWGNYFVTRVKEYNKPANMLNAMIYSDNIFFARTALKIGKTNFLNQVKNFGIGEQMPFEFPMTRSQFDADGVIKNEIQLADSGYGQGEILMNPLHLAMIYSAFVNEGNIPMPYLQLIEDSTPKPWKSGSFTPEAASLILNQLTGAVQDPEGTGNQAHIAGLSIAGKTGTAEVKLTQGDKEGTELGWFVAFDSQNPELLVLMMIEDVKGRGGSKYVVPRVRKVLEKFQSK